MQQGTPNSQNWSQVPFRNEQRSIGLCIVLTIITCGIYGIYWYYNILKDLYMLDGRPNQAGQDVLLTIVTCGIYGIYMCYQMGNLVSTARENFGLPPRNDGILYLIISLVGGDIIVDAIVQNELNIISEFAGRK